MTAYEIIIRNGVAYEFDEGKYATLVAEFVTHFLNKKNYEERLALHRNPIEVRNEVLQEVYHKITQLQWREEMRHIETKNGMTSSGYVNSQVKWIFEADKRMKSQFEAIQQYCSRYSKDIKIIAAHMAEFEAMNVLAGQIQRSIHENSNVSKNTGAIGDSTKKKRATIPRKVLSRLLKESSSKCPFCTFDDPAHLKVHHIDEDRSHADQDRLIVVCGICHDKIHAGEISREEVLRMKETLTTTASLVPPTKSNIKVNTKVAHISTGEHTVINVSSPKKVIEKYPPGCIGYDTKKANYIGKLVERYHEYKKWEVGEDKMNYAILNSQLKKQFKVGKQRSIYNIAIDEFETLAKNIQDRIDNTKLGRINKKKHPNYSPYSY